MRSLQGSKTPTVVLLVCVTAVGLRLTLSYYSLLHVPPSSDEAIAALLAESIASGDSRPLLFTGQPYQFPVEAYLRSPVAWLFQHDVLGARYQTFLLGMIATLGFLTVVHRIFDQGSRWPSILLIALPSAYWLIQQSAYAAPQYAASSVFTAALFLVAVAILRARCPALWLTFLAGVVAGLALSNYLLLASIAAAVLLVICLDGHRIHALFRVPVFSVGFMLGLAPFILAMATIPGAYEGVAAVAPLSSTVDRFFQLVLDRALPGAMAVNPPLFGDFLLRVDWGQTVRIVFVLAFALFFAAIILARARSFIIASRDARWPVFEWPDVFVLTTVLSLALMATNAKAAAHDHRYLMPVVWSFPFLVGYAFSRGPPTLRSTVAIATGLLVLFNVAVSVAVIDKWRRPAIWYYADIPRLDELRTLLRDREVGYCYASFWLAYRMTYETNGRITCAPVFNERFENWPLPPVKRLVDQKDSVAFVLSDTVGGKFRSKHFKKIMSDYGVHYDVVRFGQLHVYHDFHYPPAEGEQALSLHGPALVRGPKGVDGSLLNDGEFMQAWEPGEQQKSGQAIEIDLGGVEIVQRVTLHYPYKAAPPPRLLNLYGRKDAIWITLMPRVPYQRDLMRYVHGHPVIGGIHQTIRFPAQPLDRIRIEIAEPSGGYPWSLSEIEVGAKTTE